MKLFSLLTKDTNIDFLGKRKFAFLLSALLVIASFMELGINGLNYGIDFSGGILMDVRTDGPADIKDMRDKLGNLGIGEVNLQTIGDTGNEVMIRAQAENIDEKSQMDAIIKIKQILGDSVEYRKTELVGPAVGGELKEAGLIAVVTALLAIAAYIWFRFEWQFAAGALIALTHDVITTVGVFSLLGMDFGLTTVAAILTIAGYSINDTVVSYDRVRENLRKYKKMPIFELLNKSTNDMFSRTLLTSITTLIAVVAIFIFGGDALKSFSFALIWGVVIGTYSSIYVAMPFLTYFDLRAKKEVVSPYGDID